MTTYTSIIDSEIDTDSPVTESLMTRIRDNPIAITEGSSGAPKIQNAAIATDAVRAAQIQAGAVAASELGTNSVINAKIKIASGTSYAGFLTTSASINITLHNKSFFPMIYGDITGINVGGHSTDGGSGAAPRFKLHNNSGSNNRFYAVDYYYVAIS